MKNSNQTVIKSFVSDNKEILDYLGLISSSQEYIELSNILKEQKITSEQYILAEALIHRLGDNFSQYETELQSRIKHVVTANYPTITLYKEDNVISTESRQHVNFTVTTNQEYTISSTDTIRTTQSVWATPRDYAGRKQWTIKIQTGGTYTMTSGNTTITITAQNGRQSIG